MITLDVADAKGVLVPFQCHDVFAFLTGILKVTDRSFGQDSRVRISWRYLDDFSFLFLFWASFDKLWFWFLHDDVKLLFESLGG